MAKPKYIVPHHSVSPRDASITGTESSINKSHKERFKDPKTGVNNYKSSLGWYIGYHYIIFGTGEVRQYRKDDEVGVHCKEENKNFDSIGICMIGDFSTTLPGGPIRRNEYPSQAQLIAFTKLCKDLQAKYNIPDANIRPHRYYALGPNGKPYKDCYGNKLPDNPVELFVDDKDTEFEEAQAWHMQHGLLKFPKDPTLVVTWRDELVMGHRRMLKAKEWFTKS